MGGGWIDLPMGEDGLARLLIHEQGLQLGGPHKDKDVHGAWFRVEGLGVRV